jgi:hypothetical protein
VLCLMVGGIPKVGQKDQDPGLTYRTAVFYSAIFIKVLRYLPIIMTE